MTDASLLLKIKHLKEQKDYDGIIALIDALDPSEVFPQIHYEKIAAYINHSGHEYLLKALKSIRALDDTWKVTTVRNFMMAAWALRMEQPMTAYEILKTFNTEVMPEEQAEVVKTFLDYTKKTHLAPNAQSLTAKIQKCWDAFLEHDDEIREHVANNELQRANIISGMCFYELMNEGLFIIIESYDDIPRLIISTQAYRQTVPIARLMTMLAPDSIKAKWTIEEGFLHRRARYEIPPGADGVTPVLKFAITDNHGILTLLVESETVKTMPMLPVGPLVRSLMVSLMQQTSEAAFMQCFAETKIVETLPESAKKATMDDIVTLVKEQVPNWKTITFQDLLDKWYETHYPVKAITSEWVSRDQDIVYLKTNQPLFMIQTMQGNLLEAKRYEALHIQPVYFAFRTRQGIEADKDLLTRLIEALNEEPLLGTVIGYAHGRQRVYLDVLASDLANLVPFVIETLKGFAQASQNDMIDLTLYSVNADSLGVTYFEPVPNALTPEALEALSAEQPVVEPFVWFGEPNDEITNNDVFDTVENLFKEGQIDDVYLLLINMSPASLTKRARLLLTIAKIFRMQRTEVESPQDVFATGRLIEECSKELQNLKDDFAGTVDYETLQGLIDFMTNQEGPAIEHLEAALMAPDAPSVYFDPEELRNVLDRCKKIVSNPKFPMHFFEKCHLMSQFIGSVEDALRNADGDTNQLIDNSDKDYNTIVRQFFGDFDVKLIPPNAERDHFQIVMNANHDQTVAFEMVLMRECLRQEPDQHWDIQIEGIEKNADGIYDPSEHMHFVQIDPSEIRSHRVRHDVVKAYTMTPELWLDFQKGVNTHVNELHNHGLVPIMIMLPHTQLNEITRLSWLDHMATALMMALPDEVAHYTGKALGLNNDYLDFMVANVPAFIKTAKACFEEEGISHVNYQVFRTNANLNPLTYEIQKVDEALPPNTLLN